MSCMFRLIYMTYICVRCNQVVSINFVYVPHMCVMHVMTHIYDIYICMICKQLEPCIPLYMIIIYVSYI